MISMFPDLGNADAFFCHVWSRDGEPIHSRIEMVNDQGEIIHIPEARPDLLPRMEMFDYVKLDDEWTAKLMDVTANDKIFEIIDANPKFAGLVRTTTAWLLKTEIERLRELSA